MLWYEIWRGGLGSVRVRSLEKRGNVMGGNCVW